jgi:hypothetical protein
LVVLVPTLLQIDIHLLSHCADGGGFANPRPSPDNQSQESPLMILNAFLDFTRILLRAIIYEAVFFTYLVFVLEESVEPILYFLSGFYVKKL